MHYFFVRKPDRLILFSWIKKYANRVPPKLSLGYSGGARIMAKLSRMRLVLLIMMYPQLILIAQMKVGPPLFCRASAPDARVWQANANVCVLQMCSKRYVSFIAKPVGL